MESGFDSSWVWATGLIIFVLGIACGAFFAHLMAGDDRRHTSELEEKLDRLHQEFQGYRNQVGQHFRKTSELVQAMTDSYRNVYEHLASGSETLCQDPLSTPHLDFPQRAELDAKTDAQAPDIEITNTFSEVETATLGDSPQVPNLDRMHTEEHPTHRTPSL